jgi:succinate dehydrogenase / fumarate reductase, flavoprotein subunit
MLRVSRCIAMAALARHESRGGHTRDDYPAADPEVFGKLNHVLRIRGGELILSPEPLPQMPADLQELFDPAPAAKDETKADS